MAKGVAQMGLREIFPIGTRPGISIDAYEGARGERCNELLAGAAQADITPPPGLPKAGHSANAKTGTGVRTRLYVRCTYLSSGGRSVALVHADLLSGSSLLTYRVAQRVASQTDIGTANLIIAGCHTHASGGGFFGTEFYNRFAANKAGLDPVWVDFLVDRISDTVLQAYESRAPSRLAVGQIGVVGLTRNRSLAAHQCEAAALRPDAAPTDVFGAVDPRMTVIRIDRSVGSSCTEPLSCLVSFGVHPTSVSMASDDYNADIWGPLTAATRRGIASRTGTAPVVGCLLGTHADAAPNINNQRVPHADAIRLGLRAADAAIECWDSLEADLGRPEAAKPSLQLMSAVVDFSTPSSFGLASPAIGASLLAGAYENATPVLSQVPPFKANSPKPGARGPHGAKWVLGGRFQRVIAPRRDFPSTMPFHMLRIGELAIFTTPFEVTVGAGARIETALRKTMSSAGAGPKFALVLSLVGEYAGYLTTPAEYSRQFYEGGHTLYGPNSLGAVVKIVKAMAKALSGSQDGPTELLSMAPNAAGRLIARPDQTSLRTWRLTTRRFHPGTSMGPEVAYGITRPHVGRNVRGEVVMSALWWGPTPGSLTWNRPIVRVERQDRSGRWSPVDPGVGGDDQGWSMWVGEATARENDDVTRAQLAAAGITGRGSTAHPNGDSADAYGAYAVRWFVDPSQHRADQPHRMVVLNHRIPGGLASAPITFAGDGT